MNRRFHYLLILLYMVICLVVSLYLRFPSETGLRILRHQVAAQGSGWAVDGKHMYPAWPLGLVVENGEIRYQGDVVARPGRVTIRPEIMSLLKKHPRTRLNADVWGGQVDVTAVMDGWTSNVLSHMDVSAERLQVRELPYKKWAPEGTAASGILFIRGGGDIKNGFPESGGIDITLVDLRLQTPIPMIPKMTIVFDRAYLKAALNKRTVTIKEGVFGGKLLNGRVSGSISVNRRMENSRLNLTVSVIPTPAFLQQLGPASALLRAAMGQQGGKEMKIRLQGTLARPRVTT